MGSCITMPRARVEHMFRVVNGEEADKRSLRNDVVRKMIVNLKGKPRSYV
jgi:hypothetical protein